MPNILTLETRKYAVKLDNFEGPIDLLCNLIEKNKMDIYDIKLDQITDQYIEYLNKAQELNLEIASEFVSMASTLLYIKSKKLLPQKEEQAEEITEDELIRRIIEYKKYKDITKKLKQSLEINANRFYKQPEDIKLPKQQLEESYEEGIIPNLYQNLLKKNEQKINKNAQNIEKIAITDTYTLFSINKHNKQEVVTAFSGLLELSKREKVETEQSTLFGDINVKRKK